MLPAVSITDMAEMEASLTEHEKVREALTLINTMEQTKVLVIRDAAMAEDYNEKFLQIQAVTKELDKARGDESAPYRKMAEAINAFFKRLGARLEPKKAEFHNALIVWRRKEEEKARKEQERIRKQQEKLQKMQEKAEEEALEKGEEPPPPPPVPKFIAPKPSNVQAGASGKTHTWTDYEVEVVNMRELARAVSDGTIPDKVLAGKTSELKALAKAGIKIPGCVVHEVQKLKAQTG